MLTTRQLEVLEKIDAHIREHGVSPVLDLIAEEMVITKQAVSKLVAHLVRNKYLDRMDKRVQGLRVLRMPRRDAA